jgi:NAD+ synthase (glutamine-hydrolysing)
VSICEDLWYPEGPARWQTVEGGAQLLLNISASPYSRGKGRFRERMLGTRAADNITYLAFCNLVGGQDELVFDGHSLIVGPDGETMARGAQFEEDLVWADIALGDISRRRLLDSRLRKSQEPDDEAIQRIDLPDLPAVHSTPLAPAAPTPLPETAEIYQALRLGLRDYIHKNGFQDVVIGLSGGVDSSFTAALAADALGPRHVHGVAMPTRYSSRHSLEDAQALAENLGIDYRVVSIETVFQSFLETLAPAFEGTAGGVTEENLQPRARGTLLMALANKFGWLTLATGNKSEIGVGYSTLYGDTVGGFAPIKDVPKTLVYQLCDHFNREIQTNAIPERVLTKPPSAELKPDQKDTDSLPPYDLLDHVIEAYVERGLSPREIIDQGVDGTVVKSVIARVDQNEYKRRQGAPGVKITRRAFGKDWRVPITHRYSQ